MDTIPSPYYDKLVDNAFSEFADLLFSVGRIEYGIKEVKLWTLGKEHLKRKEISSRNMSKGKTKENSMQ